MWCPCGELFYRDGNRWFATRMIASDPEPLFDPPRLAFETDFINGFVSSGGPTAASPVAEAVRATRKGNSVEVTFSTSSELGLAGFNVYAAGKARGGEIKLNAALIPATGVAGAGSSYANSFGIADFKGNRGVIVESVLTDGSTLRAPAVEF